MTKMMPRQAVAKELGRRCSKGEYERIFCKLHTVTLRTIKRVLVDGEWQSYHPQMIVMRPGSPKHKRKRKSCVRTDFAFEEKTDA